MEWIKTVKDIIQLPVKFIIGIAIFSGSLFILPNTIITQLKLTGFINDFGTYIGIAFYAAFIIILVNIVYTIISKIQKYFSTKRNRTNLELEKKEKENKIRQKISSLDPHEKAVLREFIIQSKNTIELPIDHHVVTGLINSGIINVVSEYVTGNILIGLLSSGSLSEFARDIIFKDLEIIGMNNRQPTEQEKYSILKQRPDFILQIERHNNLYKT